MAQGVDLDLLSPLGDCDDGEGVPLGCGAELGLLSPASLRLLDAALDAYDGCGSRSRGDACVEGAPLALDAGDFSMGLGLGLLEDPLECGDELGLGWLAEPAQDTPSSAAPCSSSSSPANAAAASIGAGSPLSASCGSSVVTSACEGADAGSGAGSDASPLLLHRCACGCWGPAPTSTGPLGVLPGLLRGLVGRDLRARIAQAALPNLEVRVCVCLVGPLSQCVPRRPLSLSPHATNPPLTSDTSFCCLCVPVRLGALCPTGSGLGRVPVPAPG